MKERSEELFTFFTGLIRLRLFSFLISSVLDGGCGGERRLDTRLFLLSKSDRIY